MRAEFDIRVININSGQDQILELCQPLQDYTLFVETFRRYCETGGLGSREAASRAIAELPEGTVRSYLNAHKAEVIDMLLTEYNENKTLAAERYVSLKEGYANGVADTEAKYEAELAAKDDEIARLKAQLAAASQR